MAPGVEVGKTLQINRFPFKGLEGELGMVRVDVGGMGIVGDRALAAYAVDKLEAGNKFPFVTARIPGCEGMVLWKARVEGDEGPVMVKRKGNKEIAMNTHNWLIEEWLTNMYGSKVVVIDGRPDNSAVSVVTTGSLAELAGDLGVRAEGLLWLGRRFRSNLVIETPQLERDWIGQYKYLVIGESPLSQPAVILELAEQIKRCTMIAIKPGTSERDREVIEIVQRKRHNKFALHTSVVQSGTLEPGMTAYLDS